MFTDIMARLRLFGEIKRTLEFSCLMRNYGRRRKEGGEGFGYLGAHDGDGILFGHGVGHFEWFCRGKIV